MKQCISTQKVEKLRKNLHLRPEYMADLLCMSVIDYTLFETGYIPISKDQTKVLAEALGVSVSDLSYSVPDLELSEKDKQQLSQFKDNIPKKHLEGLCENMIR